MTLACFKLNQEDFLNRLKKEFENSSILNIAEIYERTQEIFKETFPKIFLFVDQQVCKYQPSIKSHA